MINKSEWLRVSRKNPCVICEKDDWCTYTDDGAVCCMRTANNRPMKNGGYLHKVSNDYRPYVPPIRKEAPPPEEVIDFKDLWTAWSRQTTPKSLILFAEKLGVDPMALHALGCIWAYPHNAWAFPMKNAHGEIVGIRLRNEMGHKWAVKGSKSGLFIPNIISMGEGPLYICEGPTDTAAALCMGFQPIGRPSCMGLEEMIQEYIKLNQVRRIMILADNDTPGLLGAEKLQNNIKCPSCILTLPCKDIREFYSMGGTKIAIESMIKNLIWIKE